MFRESVLCTTAITVDECVEHWEVGGGDGGHLPTFPAGELTAGTVHLKCNKNDA